MSTIDEMLASVRRAAAGDEQLRKKLLDTRIEARPLAAFCREVRELGIPLYEMDLLNAGEEYYANMRRSTNGGGENSPLLRGEDDYYELFMAELESL